MSTRTIYLKPSEDPLILVPIALGMIRVCYPSATLHQYLVRLGYVLTCDALQQHQGIWFQCYRSSGLVSPLLNILLDCHSRMFQIFLDEEAIPELGGPAILYFLLGMPMMTFCHGLKTLMLAQQIMNFQCFLDAFLACGYQLTLPSFNH